MSWFNKFMPSNPLSLGVSSKTSSQWPVYGSIEGPLVLLGFGSIGRGILPLIFRHFRFDKELFTVIDSSAERKEFTQRYGVRFMHAKVTSSNYMDILTPLLTSAGSKQGFCLNLAVETSARDIIQLCRSIGALYIDASAEPWSGTFLDKNRPTAERTCYALRQDILDVRGRGIGGATAVTGCGANPGCVSWLTKQALLNIAADIKFERSEPQTREEWAYLMRDVGIKGIHIAERDTQFSATPRPIGTFVNTWSIDGFFTEATEPAELGWGTHERWRPHNAHDHEKGSRCAIYLMQSGAQTKVRTWTPTAKPHFGFVFKAVLTPGESISISDYFTVRHSEGVTYRPTVHYAYHPCNDTVLSIHEMFGQAGKWQENHHILREDEIVDGTDELGVLLYGHEKNAYWFGSQLSIQQARSLAPDQNATGLQVTSAILAGMVWVLENREAGIVETEEMDFRRCLDIQRPYLGSVVGVYTDWNPLVDRPGLFPEDIDSTDPWQFRNVLVH